VTDKSRNNGKNTRIRSAQSASRPLVFTVFSSVNWMLLLTVALLVAYGLLVVYSATYSRANFSFSRQAMGVGIGVVALIVFWVIDYRVWARLTIPLLVASILLCVSPLIPGLGVVASGGRNWIMLFGQQVQPSEFAKVITIMMMASLVARYRGRLDSGREYLKCLGFMLMPMMSVMLQPDLGTAMVYLAIGLTVLFVGGANRWWMAATIIVGAAAVVFILTIDPVLDQMMGRDVLLKEYQINRLLVFLNENLDPDGLGYNLHQAKIAIGSGGWSGVGYMKGTQTTLGFLPEAPTDFIFCVLAEELGFLGAMVLLALYAMLVAVCLRMSLKTDAFGALIIAGCVGMWIFQIMENIGMTCGLMPITGIPLPFLSYGSSFMVMNFCAVGLIASISTRTSLEAQSKPGLDQAVLRGLES